MKNPIRIAAVMLLAACLAASSISCSREKKKSSAVKTTPISVDVPAELRASESLIKHVPENAYGFFHWNSTHPAYRRLASSPWAGGGALSLESLTSGRGGDGKFVALLKRAGIDPSERETYETLLSEAVAFASPAPEAGQKPALALLFKANSGSSLEQHALKLKEELKRSKIEIKEHEIEGGSAFSFDYNELSAHGKARKSASNRPRMRFIGWSGSVGVIATKLWPLTAALSLPGNKLPKTIDSPQFREAVADFPPAKHRYAIGYIDIAALLDDVNAAQGAETVLEDSLNLKLIPFKAAAMSLAMDDAPSNIARLLYEVKDPQHKKWFRALHASSNAALIGSMPQKPLIFLSLDGQTIRDLKQIAMENPSLKTPGASEMLAALDAVARVAVYARIAPVGQSILPVPDVLIALESTNPSAVRSRLENIIGSLAGSAGMSTGGWQEKELHGASVKFIRSQLGIGAYLAVKDSSVLIASTEPMIRSILGGLGDGAGSLASSVSQRTSQVLAKDHSLGNMYVDFQEVGSLMENMGGMLSMYAPQSEEAKQMLSPENIDSIKRMGAVIGAVKVDENSISLINFYEAAKSGTS